MDFVDNAFSVKTVNGDLSAQVSAISYEAGVFTDYLLSISLNHPANANDTLHV